MDLRERQKLLSEAEELARLDQKERSLRSLIQLKQQRKQNVREWMYSIRDEDQVQFPPAGGSSCCGCCTGLLANKHTQLAAVVCHPWGPLGGTMHDPNVGVVAGFLRGEAGITTLRLNFRSGVGRGHSSAADVMGACAFLMALDDPPSKILLVGYSYGACVVADVAPRVAEVTAFVMLAPPLGVTAPLFFGRDVLSLAVRSSKPKLALVGGADQFCSEARFVAFAERLTEPARAVVMRGHHAQCGSGCSHEVGLNHFNLFTELPAYLEPWLVETFGCSLAELSRSDGVPAKLPTQ